MKPTYEELEQQIEELSAADNKIIADLSSYTENLEKQVVLLREALESASTIGGFVFGVAKKALAAAQDLKELGK
jgi:hypothetical protein